LNNAEDRQRLLKRLNLALRIARRTVQFLGAKGFAGADLPEGNFAAEKPLAEAAMLLYTAKEERSDPEVKEAFDGLLRDLMPYARSKQTRWDLLRYPSVCLQLATPHILLGMLGCGDPEFNRLLGRAATAGASRGHELVPYRELEVIWLQSLWRAEDPGHELEETGRKTALGNPIDLLNGTRDDAYAHTHAVMYYTNFGNWQRTLPRRAEEFLHESAVVLARALIVEDYDLAAEALMAWPLTSSVWSSAAAFGFRVLASLEDKVGFLPSGPLASRRVLELAGEEKTKYALASSYHTAFVMGMLCALSLKSGRPLPCEMIGPPFSPTLIENLQAAIPQTGAYWEVVFQSLSSNEKASLGPFLLDVAIVRSSQKRDFAQMARLLEMAVQNGLADTSLCAQSAELLSRIACFDSSALSRVQEITDVPDSSAQLDTAQHSTCDQPTFDETISLLPALFK
jgi:hypothetical protein